MSGTSIERVPSDDAGHGGVSGHGNGAGHADGHGEVEVAHHGAVVSYNPDAPSEEWGWHGHWSEFAPRGRRALLGLGVVGLLLMGIFGNHVSHVEDYFLVVIAVLMALWMLRTELANKRKRRIRP